MGKYDTNWNTCGIYKITTLHNNEFYIGSAVCYNRRISLHITNLKNNKHHSIYLQNIFNKYGRDNLKFELIDSCNEEELITKEQYYIDTLKPKYNSLPTAYSNLGFKHPNSFFDKMNKKILKIDLKGNVLDSYKSIKEAAKENNINNSSVSACALGIRNTLKNNIYIFKKDYNIENIKQILYNRIEVPKINKKNGSIKRLTKVIGARIYQNKPQIIQYDLDNNFIKEWKNITDICKYNNYSSHSNLSKVLKGKRKSFMGFYWKYK